MPKRNMTQEMDQKPDIDDDGNPLTIDAAKRLYHHKNSVYVFQNNAHNGQSFKSQD